MTPTNYINTHKDRFLSELIDWLRIPSVSTSPDFVPDIAKAATYIENRLQEAGAENIQRFQTKRHPVVYAEKKSAQADAPTVLVYGHYDVQPADPYDLWETPPFEPSIRNNRLYARGACDDKGQSYIHVKALEVMQKLGNQPCHIKFLFEGEEEIGSPNLKPFLQEKQKELACDAIVISDTAMVSKDCPSITVGLRGICYLEVSLQGPARDLHSGEYGGVVDNPILALAGMLSKLKDAQGRICIPGFYDKVRPLSEQERKQLRNIPFDEDELKNRLQLKTLFGEAGYSYWMRIGARPTLDANGIWGGYLGDGAKTVLPARATAKLSMRLVPDQIPSEIEQLVSSYLTQLAPPTMHVEVHIHHSSPASLLSTSSDAYQAAATAVENTWGKAPLPLRSGGSIPTVSLFEKILGHAPVLMGFGLEEDGLHAPNESFSIAHFLLGIETVVGFHHAFYARRKQQ